MNTIINLIGNSHSKMSIYGDKSSEIVEESRRVISKYIGAEHNEIIFTKSATESLNTCIFGIEHKLKENDEILLSILEHHANIVPYQIIAKKSHSKIKYVYLKKDYGFNYEDFEEKITKKTKIVGITCDILKNRSEKLGMDIPYLIIDGSQAITHKKINLKKLKEIFAFVFSGHKLYGPQGIGVLYLKREKIGEVNPRNYGGDMIEYVLEDNVTFKEGFEKFEGGTLNIAGIYGLSKAIIYIEKVGIENIQEHLKDLTKYTIQKLKKEVRNIKIYTNKNTCRYSYICDKRNTFT